MRHGTKICKDRETDEKSVCSTEGVRLKDPGSPSKCIKPLRVLPSLRKNRTINNCRKNKKLKEIATNGKTRAKEDWVFAGWRTFDRRQAGGDQPEAQHPEIKRLEEGWEPKEPKSTFTTNLKSPSNEMQLMLKQSSSSGDI